MKIQRKESIAIFPLPVHGKGCPQSFPSPTHGKVELKIPKGTQSGKMFRIKNKGVISVRSSSTGDLYCRVNVETPVNLTKEQEDLMRQLDNSFGKSKSKHSPKQRRWIDGIKDFFE